MNKIFTALVFTLSLYLGFFIGGCESEKSAPVEELRTTPQKQTERAQAVRDYILANMPLRHEQIEANGYGPSVPIANNQTAEGRAK